MGGGAKYDASTTRAFLSTARASGVSTTIHHDSIRKGTTQAKAHPTLDPSIRNTVGKLVRESMDSTDHPLSLPIAIFLDATGSMQDTPRVFQEKLPNLMELLVDKGIVDDPHLLIGVIGDEQSDRVPLQVSQFEADDRIDKSIANLFREGGGGGQSPPTESYQLAAYFMARHAELDSLKKRNKKGYFFIVGDELPKTHVRKSVVQEVFGESIEADIPTQQIFDELQQKFEVFWIRPADASYIDSPVVTNGLNKLLGERVIILDSANSICEFIALTIATNEGATLKEATAKLRSVGVSDAALEEAILAISRIQRNPDKASA